MRTRIASSLLFAVVLLIGSAVARGAAPSDAPDVSPPGGEHPGMSIFTNDEDRARMTAIVQQAQSLRYLAYADVRTEIGITPDQESEIERLRQQAMTLGAAIRAEIREQFLSRLHPDMTEEEQAALRVEAPQIIAETILSAGPNFEKMLGEANAVLTLQQKKKLADITRVRSDLEEATGNLSVLLTAEAREACGLTLEQIDKISALLKSLAGEVKRTRDQLFGANKKPTKEDRQGDLYKDYLALREGAITRTREKILAIFPTVQSDKVKQFLDTHRGYRGRREGFGGLRPPVPPAPKPATPAPSTPAPAGQGR